MTLIEILIVIALMALLAGSLLFGTGMLGGAEQRAAAQLVVNGVRKGMARANSTGKPVRLVIDFETKSLVLEESSSKLALREANIDKSKIAQSVLSTAKSESETIVGGITPHRPSFTTTNLLGQDGEGPGRKLGSRVELRMVQTEHDAEPITAGKAALFFWPGGVTERAVVQFGSGDADGLTVVLSPLTGRARIERGRIGLPEGRFGEEFSEREEL